MRFLIMIMEENVKGVGTACYGHLNIPDELVLSPRYEALKLAMDSEFMGLLGDMLREIRAV